MTGRSTATAWWQLLRAGNVFTAISNILAGFMLARGEWQPWVPLLFLILASGCLYLAGMVLNDVFDLEIDRVERPERPLPSGRIEPKLATIVGWGLMLDGLSAAGVAAWLLKSWLPLGVALLLAGAIVAYDTRLKSTKLGPLAMGLCRALNILLGASAATTLATDAPVSAYAVAIGIYTVGLTLLARIETRGSHARQRAIQAWVSWLITLFIVLDAAACWATAGWPAALVVLLLLIPTYIATRRAPMT